MKRFMSYRAQKDLTLLKAILPSIVSAGSNDNDDDDDDDCAYAQV